MVRFVAIFRAGKSHDEGRIPLPELRLPKDAVDVSSRLSGTDASLAEGPSEADSILAPFRTNQTIGLLLLLTTFGFYSYLEMPLTSGFAALLVATLPVFFTFCRSPLSEISASALIVLAFMFAYLGLKEGPPLEIYLSAIFLGLSLDIRVQSLFFAPLLSAMALFPGREDACAGFSIALEL